MRRFLSKTWMISRDTVAFLLILFILFILAIPMFLVWINEKLDPTTPKQKWDSDREGWY